MAGMALVLVVDDELAVAEVLRAIIEDEGHEAVTAPDGRAALLSMAQRRPDLVFTDTQMPVMGGPALVAAMRQQPGLAHLPVIAMSSLTEDEVGPAYGGSFATFLRKPFRLTEVMGLLTRPLP